MTAVRDNVRVRVLEFVSGAKTLLYSLVRGIITSNEKIRKRIERKPTADTSFGLFGIL